MCCACLQFATDEHAYKTILTRSSGSTALEGTSLPHPTVIAACGDPSVLGAAFYLMEPVSGFNPNGDLPGRYATDSSWRRELGLQIVRVAGKIGEIDYQAAGLGDFGRPDGFLERQVERWRRQLESYTNRPSERADDLGDLSVVASWLTRNQPTSFSPGLMHGDFHLGNVLASYEQVEITAVVDWELATIGDPLLDLGWLLATWPDSDPRQPGTKGSTPWEGFPSQTELVEEYARVTTRPVDNVKWYLVLACFKLASILEGTYSRSLEGKASEGAGTRFHLAAINLTMRAILTIESL